MSDNYSDAPLSLADVRSDKTNKASDWTPRDMLIKMLRSIDKGEVDPGGMVMMYYTVDVKTGNPMPGYQAAGGKGGFDLIGLSAACDALMRRDGPE